MSTHTALFRDDAGGLAVRCFPSADAARAASEASGREWREPDALCAVVRDPRGGFTHARLMYGTARIYCGNWPTWEAAQRAAKRAAQGLNSSE